MKRAILLIGVLLAAASCRKTSAWEALPLGSSADFRSIYFTDAGHGWIAGGSYEITGGLIGRTEDGGRTWRFTSGLTPRAPTSVQALHFFDATRGIAGTGSGQLLSTSDGGESWTPVEHKGRADIVSCFFFLDERRGWAAGHGDILRTDDAGQAWSPLTENEDRRDRSPIRAMQFIDDRDGWVAGMDASLAYTTTGGAAWEPVALAIGSGERPHFWDLFFVDVQTGWVVGDEGVILTTRDGGVTWTRQDTGLKDAHSAPKLERIPRAGGIDVIDAGDRTPGFTIAAVRFVDRRRGWIAGFYAGLGRSLILHTEDGGQTWAMDADIAGEELRTMFVQGSERLWAIGARVRQGPQSIYRRAIATK